MNTTFLSQLNRLLKPVAFGTVMLVFALSAEAGPLSVSNVPLFSSTGVQPNVALMIDDSGSMSATDTGGVAGTKSISVCDGVTTLTAPLSRIAAAREGACQVAQDNAAAMRISLFTLVKGTSATVGGTQLTPFGSTAATLKSSINTLTASTSTPLSGAMLTILDNYAGASSPIQYRCQKNYVVFFTDGQPNVGPDSKSPLTYPTLSSAQKSTWPNSSAQSGAASNAPGWDGFLDPIYKGDGTNDCYPWLDDLSQFGFDVDLKSTASTTPAAICPSGTAPLPGYDCGGGKWDDPAFPKQNVVTYTVGFGAEANNSLLRNTPLVNQVNIVPTNVDPTADTITLQNHGLTDGQYVHYYSTPASINYSTVAAANTATNTLSGNNLQMLEGDTLTYNNAGGANLTYVVTPAVTGTSCSDVGGTMNLTSGNTYYVAMRSATELRLATTAVGASLCGNAVDGNAAVGANCFDLTTAGANGTNQKLARAATAAVSNAFTLSSPYATTNLDPSANVDSITISAGHGFKTGDVVSYSCAPATCASTRLIGGLTDGGSYFAARVSATEFRLANTPDQAANCAAAADGTAAVGTYCIALSFPSSTGTTTRTHTFAHAAVGAISASIVADGIIPTPVDSTANIEKLTFGSNHNLSTRDAVTYTCSGGVAASAVVTANSSTYYAINVVAGSPGSFQLALTPGGAALDIYNAGNSSQTFSASRSFLSTIGGLYAYETDADPDVSPNPVTEASARGKYYVEVVDSNTIKLHQCGNVAGCINGAVSAVDITSKGYGILSTGPGTSFFAATAAEIASGLSNAFSSISANTLSFSSLTTNASSQQAIGSSVYQAKFSTGDWSGDVVALPIDAAGNISSTPTWSASQNVPTPYTARKIFTWIPTSGTTGAGAVVGTVASLTATQQKSLNNATLSAADQQKVLNWVLGLDDLTLVGSRLRSHGVIGDVIAGSPNYVGSSMASYDTALPSGAAGKSTFAAYKSATASRTPMLYVGANDGMLHGIDATIGQTNSGKEIMAFIPDGVYTDYVDANVNGIQDAGETLIPKFYNLTRDEYGQIPAWPHEYFVDGEPVSGDAYFAGAKAGIAAGNWHTVLVGGLGRGGRSVYAVDVTNPSSFTPSNILWEFSDPAGRMGYSYSKPVITRLQTGEWAAIFGDGYDAAGALGRIWIINLETGAIIKRLDAPLSVGMSTVSVLKDSTGTAVSVYAGDLAGNVWKFDISNTASTSWLSPAAPFFVATDNAGNRQPITSPIELGSAPPSAPSCATGKYCTMLYFGTGTYFLNSDKNYIAGTTTPRNDTFYALYDNSLGNIPTNKSTLVQQTLSTITLPNGTTWRQGSTNAVNYTSATPTNAGWYMNLVVGSNYEGERVVFKPVLVGPLVLFVTIVPAGADVCVSSGSSWLMGMNALDGKMPTRLFDTNNDGVFDSQDAPTVGTQSPSGYYTAPVVGVSQKSTTAADGTVTNQTVITVDLGKSTTGGDHFDLDGGGNQVFPKSVYQNGRMSWRQLQ